MGRWRESGIGERDAGGIRGDGGGVRVGHGVGVHDGIGELLEFGQAECR